MACDGALPCRSQLCRAAWDVHIPVWSPTLGGVRSPPPLQVPPSRHRGSPWSSWEKPQDALPPPTRGEPTRSWVTWPRPSISGVAPGTWGAGPSFNPAGGRGSELPPAGSSAERLTAASAGRPKPQLLRDPRGQRRLRTVGLRLPGLVPGDRRLKAAQVTTAHACCLERRGIWRWMPVTGGDPQQHAQTPISKTLGGVCPGHSRPTLPLPGDKAREAV